jgi:hypothetical protein
VRHNHDLELGEEMQRNVVHRIPAYGFNAVYIYRVGKPDTLIVFSCSHLWVFKILQRYVLRGVPGE